MAKVKEGQKSSTREEYQLRINRVIDYIHAHISEDLTPRQLAHAAPFSLFHFHRIFQAITGETVSAFIKRIRLEKGANRIMHDQSISITQIAMDLNFSSHANFSRAFKEHFGITPSRFQQGKKPRVKKRRPVHRRRLNFETEVKEFSPFTIAYKRSIGPYDFRVLKLYNSFHAWAFPRGLIHDNSNIIAIAHDNPHLTDRVKCRYDVGVILEGETDIKDINLQDINPRLCACVYYRGPARRLDRVYDYIYVQWLPESGFQPGEGSIFTIHSPSIFKSIRHGKFEGTICLPVVPL